MSQGYDDLLYGLGSDDLDDFDFDVKDESFVEPHEYDEYGEDDPFFNGELPCWTSNDQRCSLVHARPNSARRIPDCGR